MITNKELTHKLVDAFDEIELTPAEVDDALREAGYDPDEVGARMKAISETALTNCITLKDCITLKEHVDQD